MMRLSKNGEEFIIKEEGERLRAYQDSVGIWTIGVGHTGFIDDIRVGAGMRITQEQSRQVFRFDIARYERAVNKLDVPLNQNQFDALVSLAFNIGEGAFARSTLASRLVARDYKSAANHFLDWKRAGSRPILLNRRRREKALFEKAVK